MADPQNPVKTVGLALNGQQINLDSIQKHNLPAPRSITISSEYEEFEPSLDVDYSDLSSVNRELSQLRLRLHRVRKELKEAERQAVRLKYAYEQEKKRYWIGISGGSDKSREAMAELLSEEAYSKQLVASVVAKEIMQHSRDIRTELDTLKEISNNLRRQIDLQ